MATERLRLRLAPVTKTARQSRIADLVADHPVRSQGELAELLASDGVRVTQATLSRDLEELGVVKVEGSYRVPASPAPMRRTPKAGRLARLSEELLTSAEAARNLVVVRTPPGGAHLLASAIDSSDLDRIVGSVAGDDTVLIVCRTDAAAAALADTLLALADGRTATRR